MSKKNWFDISSDDYDADTIPVKIVKKKRYVQTKPRIFPKKKQQESSASSGLDNFLDSEEDVIIEEPKYQFTPNEIKLHEYNIQEFNNFRRNLPPDLPSKIKHSRENSQVVTKKEVDLKEFDESYYTVGNRALCIPNVDAYMTLLKTQGNIVKSKTLGKVLVVPCKFFLMVYRPPKNPPVDAAVFEEHHNDYLYQNLPDDQRFRKAEQLINNEKFNNYNFIFIPSWIYGHWILLILQINDKKILVYDSLDKNYSDVIKSINSFIKYQKLPSFRSQYIGGLPAINDDWDCGVFMLEYARNELHENTSDGNSWSQWSIPSIRERMKTELKNKKLISNYKYQDDGVITKGPYKRREPKTKEKQKSLEEIERNYQKHHPKNVWENMKENEKEFLGIK